MSGLGLQLEYLLEGGARIGDVRGVEVAVDFGDTQSEYAAALGGAGLYPALDRGLIEVAGHDRVAWLHNLTTNTVRDLHSGEGDYAFVVNVKGRIVLDLNVLMARELIRLDVDRRAIPAALNHFGRYTISEDVSVQDLSGLQVRFVLLGPAAIRVAGLIGLPYAAAMAQLGSAGVELLGQPAMVFRNDLAGVFGLEVCVPVEAAADVWSFLLQAGRPEGLKPIGRAAVRTLQIEAGIPVWGEEIDDEVLPAETLQMDRAVSLNKGCYVGYEVVERMRSRHALPRRLVGLGLSRLPADLPRPVGLQLDGKDVGRLMSCCESPAVGSAVGLGYLLAGCVDPGSVVTVAADPPIEAHVVELPLQADPRVGQVVLVEDGVHLPSPHVGDGGDWSAGGIVKAGRSSADAEERRPTPTCSMGC